MEKQVTRIYPGDNMQLISPSGKIITICWAEDRSHVIIEVPVGLES